MKVLSLSLLFLASTSAFALDDQAKYNAIPGAEFNVQYSSATGGPVEGVGTNEKRNGDLLCQKYTVVAPGAIPSYQCFFASVKGAAAESAYNALPGAELTATFTSGGHPIVGTRTLQKNAKNGFCREVSAVVPKPVPTYTCYGLESEVSL